MIAHPIRRGVDALVRLWTHRRDDTRLSSGAALEDAAQDTPTMQIDLETQFVNPRLTHLMALWASKRDGTFLPCKADFRPRELARQLRHIAFLEIPYPDAPTSAYRMGFMGSALAEVFGDCGGKTLQEHFPAPMCLVFDAAFRHAVFRKAPIRAHGTLTVSGRPHLAHETLVVPLADDGLTPNFVVSAIYFRSAADIPHEAGNIR